MTPFPNSDGSFISWVRQNFGTQMVRVIHPVDGSDDEQSELEAQVQSDAAYFDVDAPVYEGDRLELIDPRGGTRKVWITSLEINQAGGMMSSDLSHIKASFSDKNPASQSRTYADRTTFGDNAIFVSGGSHVTIAAHGGSIAQGQTVPPEYSELAKAVKQALELIQKESSFDGEDREIAKQASSGVLEEIVKEEPNPSKLKGSLATLRGVLTAATNSASSAAASGIIQQLFLATSQN